ncbi:Insulinase family protein [Candidatus Sulfopaludibacter sp. SbA3]|nr:Insulinase family protein [Candidatus Sulfopaludibacter sp. SbA3]
MLRRTLLILTVVLMALAAAPDSSVLRATLDNGLRVVIVRDPLAPVVTVEENYLAGGNETPSGFPGMAHAQEHMAFRGCAGLSSDQIAAIYAQLGGNQNADTQQNITQYFVTLPAQDLEVALRLDAACMQDVQDSEEQWAEERGAIEQEVARDLSNPTYKFITRLNEDLFSGTPYAHDALGTKASFDGTTGAMLKKFYQDWYAPNNAILVIAGDVDSAATLAKVKQLYGSIKRRPIPAHPEINLPPVKPDSFTLDSNLPYELVFVAFRMPGTDSPDFAAIRILSDVIGSQRADLYGLVPQGKALGTEFGVAETYPKASVGFALAAVPAGADPAPITAELKTILAGYADKGVPAALVDAAKKGEIAGADFQENSIPDLAASWSQALAGEGRESPSDIVEAMKKVTLADVNRVAKTYLTVANAVVATLKPSASGEAVAGKGFGGAETTTAAPTKPVTLPDWAEASVKSLKVPQASIPPTDVKLANGLRLIVRTERASPTVTVIGSVKHEADLQTPAGKEGSEEVLAELFSYGTETRDRLKFQEALDDIAASESAGTSFNLKVLKQDFAKGVELLADNELHPALPAEAFPIVQGQTAEVVSGTLASPGYRASKALETALLPKGDPSLREPTPQTVSALTLADIKTYYARIFRPDMTTIAVIGDITTEEARPVIEKWFGPWKNVGPKPTVILPAVPPNKPAAVNVPDPTQVQDSVELALEIPVNRFHPDYYALQLGDHVLGGGFYATRLYRDLRQKNGYVYNVDNSLHASETRATYSVTYGCDAENVSKARLLVEQELAAMRTTNVTAAELQQAKALLLRQISMSESSEDAVAGGFVARAMLGLPLDEPIRAAQRYYALTADQIRAAFEKWIRPGAFVQVVRGPAPK